MSRAYLVLTRNDLTDGHLQLLDLKPNVSQRNQIYDPKGQTTYKSFLVQNDTTTLTGADPITTESDCYGLTAYILDRVEDNSTGGNISLSDARTIATDILDRAFGGLSLTLSDIDAIIDAADSGSSLTGGNSFGSVEDILKILSGEVYLLPDASALTDGGGNFLDTADRGYFVTTPNIIKSQSVAGVRGLSTTHAPTIPRSAPVQTGTQNVNFRNIRTIVDTSELHLSVLSGQLSKLIQNDYTFINPSYTYGTGGTALDIEGNEIPADGAARAIVVYDKNGNVIG